MYITIIGNSIWSYWMGWNFYCNSSSQDMRIASDDIDCDDHSYTVRLQYSQSVLLTTTSMLPLLMQMLRRALRAQHRRNRFFTSLQIIYSLLLQFYRSLNILLVLHGIIFILVYSCISMQTHGFVIVGVIHIARHSALVSPTILVDADRLLGRFLSFRATRAFVAAS